MRMVWSWGRSASSSLFSCFELITCSSYKAFFQQLLTGTVNEHKRITEHLSVQNRLKELLSGNSGLTNGGLGTVLGNIVVSLLRLDVSCDGPSACFTLLLLCFLSPGLQTNWQLGLVCPMYISQSRSLSFGQISHFCCVAFGSLSLFLQQHPCTFSLIHTLHYWLHRFCPSIHLSYSFDYFVVNKIGQPCYLVYPCVSRFCLSTSLAVTKSMQNVWVCAELCVILTV